MFPIFIDLGYGEEKYVQIPEDLYSSDKIKEFLEEKYQDYIFDEESLMGLEYGSRVNAKPSFKCFEGMNDYDVLIQNNHLSKMYIESREKLNFNESDFTMDMLKGYQCCVTELMLIQCFSLTSLKHIPQSITNLNLWECSSLTSLEHIPQGITDLNLCSCESLTSLKHIPQGITDLDIGSCYSLTSLKYIPQSVINLDLYGCDSLISLEHIPKGVTYLVLRHCSSLSNDNNYIPLGCKVIR